MRVRYKILGGIGLVVVAAALSGALYMSHSSPCGAAAPLPTGVPLMKASVYRCYGSPDVVGRRRCATWRRGTPAGRSC